MLPEQLGEAMSNWDPKTKFCDRAELRLSSKNRHLEDLFTLSGCLTRSYQQTFRQLHFAAFVPFASCLWPPIPPVTVGSAWVGPRGFDAHHALNAGWYRGVQSVQKKVQPLLCLAIWSRAVWQAGHKTRRNNHFGHCATMMQWLQRLTMSTTNACTTATAATAKRT